MQLRIVHDNRNARRRMALPLVRTRASERTRRTNDRATQGTGEDFTTTRTNKEGNQMTQRKYTPEELVKIKDAIDAIDTMPPWCEMSEGRTFWSDVLKKLHDKAKHGTTDGNPWIEPELTDEDALRRPWVMVRQELQREWTGPCILVCVTKERYSFTAAEPDLSQTNTWQECRLATPEEIEAANVRR